MATIIIVAIIVTIIVVLFFFNVTLLVGVKHYLNVVLWMEEPGGLQSMGSLRVGHD